jgi:chemotaxis protein MotB
MNTIARIIGKLPNPLRLEGHTDSKPISNIRFKNNWELSAARAIAVLESFAQSHGIPPSRLAVVAYADTMPKAANDSEAGRSANRRVDVTILNEQFTKHEPRNSR